MQKSISSSSSSSNNNNNNNDDIINNTAITDNFILDISILAEDRKELLDVLNCIREHRNPLLLLEHIPTIERFLQIYLKQKPWQHMYNAILLCCSVSPLALSLIVNNSLEGGGKITHAVFGKKPHEVPNYYSVYPLDILLYAVRIDTMLYPELALSAEKIFMKIASMEEFKKFKDAVREFL